MCTKAALPEICAKCGKLKVVSLGVFRKDHQRYSRRYFICHNCLEEPVVKRWGRFEHPETPVEREARKALEAIVEQGYFVAAEYEVDGKNAGFEGSMFYDFAIPKLRMLIEIDSFSYHHKGYHKKRDKRKNLWAEENQWHLVRVRPSDRMAEEITQAVWKRAHEFAH